MEIKKLLYATDIEDPDFTQVEHHMVLRKLGLEEVMFLHPNTVEGWERRVADFGLKSRAIINEGPILSRILDTTSQEGISIVTVNLKRGPKKVLRNTLIKNLLRASPVPVIVINKEVQISVPVEKGLFHHCIFATDWSPISESAVNYILNFKEIIEMLEIVNVINKKLSIRDMLNLKKKLGDTRRIFLDKGIDAESHIYAGKPSEEIILAAEDYNATSIIMGTSYKSPVKRFFSSGCACRTAQEAVVPVMVIGHSSSA